MIQKIFFFNTLFQDKNENFTVYLNKLKISFIYFRCLLYFLILFSFSFFQTNALALTKVIQKPSFYEHQNQNKNQNKKDSTFGRFDSKQDNQKENPALLLKQKPKILFLHRINEQEDFNKLARVYYKNTSAEIPHLIFVIDLANKNKIYYLNTPYFQLHDRFVMNQKLIKFHHIKNLPNF